MTGLREKVARAMRDASMTDSTLPNLADAAIRVCREHFAGVVAEWMPEPDGAPDAVWTPADVKLSGTVIDMIAAIRADGK